MAKDTDSVPETSPPAQYLQYPDGDYSGDDVKPLDIFLRSDGCVVPQARPAASVKSRATQRRTRA